MNLFLIAVIYPKFLFYFILFYANQSHLLVFYIMLLDFYKNLINKYQKSYN